MNQISSGECRTGGDEKFRVAICTKSEVGQHWTTLSEKPLFVL